MINSNQLEGKRAINLNVKLNTFRTYLYIFPNSPSPRLELTIG